MQDLIALAMELNAEDYRVKVEYHGDSFEIYVCVFHSDSLFNGLTEYEPGDDNTVAACDWLRKDHEQFRKGKS